MINNIKPIGDLTEQTSVYTQSATKTDNVSTLQAAEWNSLSKATALAHTKINAILDDPDVTISGSSFEASVNSFSVSARGVEIKSENQLDPGGHDIEISADNDVVINSENDISMYADQNVRIHDDSGQISIGGFVSGGSMTHGIAIDGADGSVLLIDGSGSSAIKIDIADIVTLLRHYAAANGSISWSANSNWDTNS